ncbi:response regulator transcription factor [Clostridium cellulovorans]|uniref:Stage 0 sporulation protein A homolog n=1 Tax=Clostridium cellulovorans (strain ATCC 35296 / DSM 3052 / OCM 3 / 743B) TaxID=573061 RepID=D9SWB3_CLOC7|nr:response regulator transcription factor [Clostridium cellulovorans]ADL51257.1 two component transcriptional regulator, winged helix family [Clostridium cellulovorans 743B]
MNYKILIAEDDKDIIDLLKLYLENEKFQVLSAINGEEALEIVENNEIHLAILDIMMPKLNGFELTKKIREISNMPILILSAKNLDSDKILGLDLGADDYLTKPFNPLEIIARVKSSIRRCYNLKADEVASEKENILTVGELSLNTESFMLTKGGNEISITPTEYRILALLMKSPGRVYTKMQIYELIKGEYFESDENTIMVHISKLRDKIEDDSKNPLYIKTIRGLGYKIEKQK